MSLYSRNLTSLKTLFPGILPLLENSPSGIHETLPTRSGEVTIRRDGMLLHSSHYPRREAEKLVRREIREDTEFCLFYGFGMGYHIEAFRELHPRIPCAVVEPDTSLFRRVLELRDFTSLFDSGGVSLILGTDPEAVTVLLEKVRTTHIQTFTLRPVYLTNKEYFDRLDGTVRDYLSRREINTNTLNRFSRLWISNICRNLPLLSRAPGIRILRDRFRDTPVLLLAAGPSLTAILPRLPELRRRMLVVCVDTALKACLAAGTEPDFTVLTDPQYWNTRHMDRCRLKRSILISDISTYPTVFRQTDGPVFFCSTPFPLAQYLESRTEEKGKLRSGGSVATAAWDLARQLGSRRIYCAGLDLSFPDRQTHFRGGTFEERVHQFSRRTAPGETAGWHALRDGNPYRVQDYNGNSLLTDQRMKIYISWFEKQMELYPQVRTENLSSRGIRLEGMPSADPAGLSALPEIRPVLDRELDEIRRCRTAVEEQQVRQALEELCAEMEVLEKLTARGQQYSLELVCRGIRQDLLEELTRIDRSILETGSREIIGFILQPFLEKLLTAPRKELTPEEILKRSASFYDELHSSLEFHLKEIRSVCLN